MEKTEEAGIFSAFSNIFSKAVAGARAQAEVKAVGAKATTSGAEQQRQQEGARKGSMQDAQKSDAKKEESKVCTFL